MSAERESTPLAGNRPAGDPSPSDMRSLIRAARKDADQVGVLEGGETVQMSVSVVKRPPDGSFWRVRDEDGWRAPNNMFSLLPPKMEGDRKEYLLVTPEMEEILGSDERTSNLVQPHMLAFMVNTRGEAKWWAVHATASHSWASSARAAMREMQQTWGMVKALGQGYAVKKPMDNLGEPVWPKGDATEWLMRAFEGRVIDSPEHPVVKQLQGRL